MARLAVYEGMRTEHELELRSKGYVPVTSYDAAMPHLEQLLPACRVVETVHGKKHGLVVWSHPGPSGLDPRATAPLALVRVADGVGGLDEPLTLPEALRWLLEGDVEAWLQRSRHRAYASQCLLERSESGLSCATHVGYDPELQGVADALGDTSFRGCSVKGGRAAWTGAPVAPAVPALAEIGHAALAVVQHLASWHALGVVGTVAWELARQDLAPGDMSPWEAEGFTPAEVSVWVRHGSPTRCAALRELAVEPSGRLELPARPVAPLPGTRGVTGFARWNMQKHGGNLPPLVLCQLCGAKDHATPCSTCVSEGRTDRIHEGEWTSYFDLAQVHPAFTPGNAGPSVVCGICRTDMAP